MVFPWFSPYFWWKALDFGPRCPGQDAMEGWAPGPFRRHPWERRLRRRSQGGGANRCADREPVLKAQGDEGWDFGSFWRIFFRLFFQKLIIFHWVSDGFLRISAGNLKRFGRILVYSGWFVMICAEILIAVNRMLVVIWWLFTGFYGDFRWTWFAIYLQYSWHFHNFS